MHKGLITPLIKYQIVLTIIFAIVLVIVLVIVLSDYLIYNDDIRVKRSKPPKLTHRLVKDLGTRPDMSIKVRRKVRRNEDYFERENIYRTGK